MYTLISAQEALEHLIASPNSSAFLDVRSEGEYSKAHIGGFVNTPILNDHERHLVGIHYKQHGREITIQFGRDLVEKHRTSRVTHWKSLSKSFDSVFVTCWRGGLRSQFAQSWLKDEGTDAVRIWGGYKEVRGHLLNTFSAEHQFLVLSALTGSGKTEVLNRCSGSKIDLENLANHRGSSFGSIGLGSQPGQSQFENDLGLELFRRKNQEILVEDESLLIGAVSLPLNVKNLMRQSPVVLLHEPLEQRALRIAENYILKPAQEMPLTELQKLVKMSLTKIKNRLGGLLESQISKDIDDAFSSSECLVPRTHRSWIEKLLIHYYDPRYLHAFQRQNRPVVFEGNSVEVMDWLKKRALEKEMRTTQ